MIPVIIITHGTFGHEILQTAQGIVGRQESAFSLSVTSEFSPESLGQAVEQLLARHSSEDGHLFLVDMLGGTPCNVSMLKTRDRAAEVVTGVNLYMTISAFRHRTEMPLAALAAKVAEDGRRAITLPKELLKKRTGAA